MLSMLEKKEVTASRWSRSTFADAIFRAELYNPTPLQCETKRTKTMMVTGQKQSGATAIATVTHMQR